MHLPASDQVAIYDAAMKLPRGSTCRCWCWRQGSTGPARRATGRQGHNAPRRQRHRRELRAHPPQQPRPTWCAALQFLPGRAWRASGSPAARCSRSGGIVSGPRAAGRADGERARRWRHRGVSVRACGSTRRRELVAFRHGGILPTCCGSCEPRLGRRTRTRDHRGPHRPQQSKERALALGFDLCGWRPPRRSRSSARSPAGSPPDSPARCTKSRRTRRQRGDPRDVSAVGARLGGRAWNRLQHRPPVLRRRWARPATALIARYAWGDDYHDVIGAQASTPWWGWMREGRGVPFEGPRLRGHVARPGARVRRAAVSGLGRQEHLSHPPGARVVAVLAEILTNLDLEPDTPGTDRGAAAARSASTRVRRARWCSPASWMPGCASPTSPFELKGPVPEPLEPGLGPTSSAATSARRCARGTRWRRGRRIRPGSLVRSSTVRGSTISPRGATTNLRWQMRGSAMRRAGVEGAAAQPRGRPAHRGAGPGV